jgi:hypothetical protein
MQNQQHRAGYLAFRTTAGLFCIVQRVGGCITAFQDEVLDAYHTPEEAAAALATGAGTWPSFGSTVGLGIPADLALWTFVSKD